MPWITNAMGAAFVGFGVGGVGDMALTYAQDAYTDVSFPRLSSLLLPTFANEAQIIGDAFVAVAMVRNLVAMALVFALPPWLEHMGAYDMFVLLGCLTWALGLTGVPMVVWGRGWRGAAAGRYRWFAGRQYSPRSG